jgi:lipoic acid synthetase
MQAKSKKRVLEILDWGCLDYREALKRQLELVAARQEDKVPDSLILVEHPPVITLGRGGGGSDLLLGKDDLRAKGFGLFETDRGGKATSHMPGQMVAYPVVRVGDHDLHRFLENLLKACSEVIRGLGLKPERNPDQPGLWVNGAKAASVGIAVKKWVTYHGLALNVCPDLSGFDLIVPCGLPGQPLTSLEKELGRKPDMEQVKKDFAGAFAKAFDYTVVSFAKPVKTGHPKWLVRPAPPVEPITRMENLLKEQSLATVCQSARCPNLGECFNRGTATFMILGDRCTRNCRFCAVEKAPLGPPDPQEPKRLAVAAQNLNLDYVVITSVTRDDLPDGGSRQFADCIYQVRRKCPAAKVEVLTPDFQGKQSALATVFQAGPDVFNHNLETVPRLYRAVRPQAVYRRSLEVLGAAAAAGLLVKSGLMLGLGEEFKELKQVFKDLVRAGCVSLTLGQYLPPSADHAPLVRYVPPEEFAQLKNLALSMGFRQVAAGPLVRSSYRAEELFYADQQAREA